MKIRFLGTAAFEGIPALFCTCQTCKKARERGGKDIRTRSQALINDNLLVDFNADTFMHTLQYGIELAKVNHCLITHGHSDHLYPADIAQRIPGYSHIDNRECFHVYGSEIVTRKLKNSFPEEDPQNDNAACFHMIKPYTPFKILDYEITALEAKHGETSGPYIYMIKQGHKTMLYAHDTGYFFARVFAYCKENGVRFDFVSLDCTLGFCKFDRNSHHMTVEHCADVKRVLCKNGNADENTVFYLNHFSHNGDGVLYDEMCEKVKEYGFKVSYDGLEAEF